MEYINQGRDPHSLRGWMKSQANEYSMNIVASAVISIGLSLGYFSGSQEC